MVPEGPTREIIELMHELKSKSVDVKTKILIGAGVSSVFKVSGGGLLTHH